MLILTLLSVACALFLFLYLKFMAPELFVLAKNLNIFIKLYFKKNKGLFVAIGLLLAIGLSLLIKYNNLTKKIITELKFLWFELYQIFNPISINSKLKDFDLYHDLKQLTLYYIIISIIFVSVFAGILILSFLFKRNIYLLTAIMLIGLLFLVTLNWFFHDDFRLLRYSLLKLLFLIIRKPDKFLRKFINFSYTNFLYFVFNYYTFAIENPLLDKLLSEILYVILVLSFIVFFWFSLLLFALLVLGLFMIRLSFYGLVFLTVFVVGYFLLL